MNRKWSKGRELKLNSSKSSKTIHKEDIIDQKVCRKSPLFLKNQLKSLYKINDIVPLSVGRRIKIEFPNEDLKKIDPFNNFNQDKRRINELIRVKTQISIPQIPTPKNELRNNDAQFMWRVYSGGLNKQKYLAIKSKSSRDEQTVDLKKVITKQCLIFNSIKFSMLIWKKFKQKEYYSIIEKHLLIFLISNPTLISNLQLQQIQKYNREFYEAHIR